MKYIVFFLCICISVSGFSQQETFDLITYTPPKGWKKEFKENVVGYSNVDNAKKTWCRISVYRSTASKGTIDQDFISEWNDLVAKPYQINKAPQTSTTQDAAGWKIKGGSGTFVFNNSDAAVLLTTMSDNSRVVSITAMTNSQDYMPDIEKFVETVSLKKSTASNAGTKSAVASSTNTPKATPVKSSYKFTTTNFDDGWVATEQADWVQVAKGNVKVLLHYPTNRIDVSSYDVKTIANNAWNTLVAPRYSNLKNFILNTGNLDYLRPMFMSGNVLDPATGKVVYVVLFKRGESGWIEVVSPDKNTFVQVFGVDSDIIDNTVSMSIWEPLQKMAGYNRFGVAMSDLTGKWTNNFSGMTQYVNVYTGASAGMDTHSSAQVFAFSGNSYHWQISSASGFVGSIKFQGAKSNGQFKVPTNWQIYFSDIEAKPRTYDAYFSCIKGARVLWLQDHAYPSGFTAYGKSE